MDRRPRTQPPEVRREQILRAAADVLTEKGFAAMTMADVALRAGLAKGTLYLYFVSKEQLVAALQETYQREIVEQAADLVDGDGAFIDRLDRFLALGFDYHRARVGLHHVLFHETGMREDESMRALERALAAGLRRANTAGELHIDDADATARFLLYGLHGLLVSSLHAKRPSRKRYLDEATSLCHRLLVDR